MRYLSWKRDKFFVRIPEHYERLIKEHPGGPWVDLQVAHRNHRDAVAEGKEAVRSGIAVCYRVRSW